MASKFTEEQLDEIALSVADDLFTFYYEEMFIDTLMGAAEDDVEGWIPEELEADAPLIANTIKGRLMTILPHAGIDQQKAREALARKAGKLKLVQSI